MEICNELAVKYPDMKVFCFDELSSTNQFLKDYFQKNKSNLFTSFCMASRQTSGYGQRGRSWLSDASSLTFSLSLRFNVSLEHLNGLSQLIALELVESLSLFTGQVLQIKWPNDIYCHSLKVAGILIECISHTDTDSWLVIGIGMNNGFKGHIKDDLLNETSLPGSINLAKEHKTFFLMDCVARYRNLALRFHSNLFNQAMHQYQMVDYFEKGTQVIVYDSATKQAGVYQGLKPNGEILVEINKTVQAFRSGSVSIRPA